MRRRLYKKASIMDRLPIELHRCIVEWVDQADLLVLLLVSKNFRDEAERLLYRCIIIGHDHSLKSRMQLFKHLVGCDRVAAYVRDFLVVSVLFTCDHPDLAIRYWRALNMALRAVTHLKSLHLDMSALMFDDRRAHAPFCLLSGCTFKLNNLSIDGVRDINRAALEVQGEVKRLRLADSNGITFSPSAFRNLSTLSIWVDSDIFTQLINGRRVNTLGTQASFISPTIYTESVTSLNICAPTLNNLPQIYLSFPSVQYVALFFDQITIKENSWIIQKMVEMLSKLSQLQKFILAGTARTTPELRPQPLFEQVASLQVVVFHPDIYSVHHVEWIRGAPNSTEVEWCNCWERDDFFYSYRPLRENE